MQAAIRPDGLVLRPSAAPTSKSKSTPTPTPEGQRRHDARFLLQLDITMEGHNNFYRGLSENLSESGVFIATYTRLPIGTVVALSFTLPKSQQPISVVGVVRWWRDPDATADELSMVRRKSFVPAPSVVPGMGVQFTDVSREALEAIRGFMKRRNPEFYD